MKNLKRIFILALAIFFLNIYFYGLPLLSKGSAMASYTREYGLNMVKFETHYGKIYIDLPDDMAKGDIISGKLMAKPRGKTVKKHAKNMDILKNHMVEINNQRTPVGKKWGKWTITDPKELTITLLNHKGKDDFLSGS
jgi:hypothetical protein